VGRNQEVLNEALGGPSFQGSEERRADEKYLENQSREVKD
jgi:hypothetical protein